MPASNQDELQLLETAFNGPGRSPRDARDTLTEMTALSDAFVQELIARLKSEQPKVRVRAAFLAGRLPAIANEMVAPLMEAMQHRTVRMRITATRSLAHISQTGDIDGDTLSRIVHALLVRALRDGDRDTREAAADGLGKLPARRALAWDELVTGTKHPWHKIRRRAVIAMAYFPERTEAFGRLLHDLATDPHEKVRSAAVLACCITGAHSRETIPTLIKRRYDTDHVACEAAKHALKSVAKHTNHPANESVLKIVGNKTEIHEILHQALRDPFLPQQVADEFSQLCQRRILWRINVISAQGRRLPHATNVGNIHELVDVAATFAAGANDEFGNQKKRQEYAWMMSKLAQIWGALKVSRKW